MRPIWRNTLGVATVAIVAATDRGRPDLGLRPGLRCRTPPHRRIVGGPGVERLAQDRHPDHRRQGPRHWRRHQLAGRHGPPARGRLGAERRDPTGRQGRLRLPRRRRGRTVLRHGGRGALQRHRPGRDGLRRREHRHRSGHRALHHGPQPGAFSTHHAQGRGKGPDPALDRRHRAEGRQGPGERLLRRRDRPLHRGRGQDREDLARRQGLRQPRPVHQAGERRPGLGRRAQG